MRLRFALAAALPALVSLGAMALLADWLAQRALEEELGARLVVVAQAAAAELPAERLVALAPGDEGTRTYGHICNRLRALSRATGTGFRHDQGRIRHRGGVRSDTVRGPALLMLPARYALQWPEGESAVGTSGISFRA